MAEPRAAKAKGGPTEEGRGGAAWKVERGEAEGMGEAEVASRAAGWMTGRGSGAGLYCVASPTGNDDDDDDDGTDADEGLLVFGFPCCIAEPSLLRLVVRLNRPEMADWED